MSQKYISEMNSSDSSHIYSKRFIAVRIVSCNDSKKQSPIENFNFEQFLIMVFYLQMFWTLA